MAIMRALVRSATACGLAAMLCLTLGCAAWTNPIANGIPVRLLPPELLAEPKENLEQIPLTTLRRKSPEQYLLGPGDLLGVYIENILGQEGQLPPVNAPPSASQPPSLGFPIPVDENGALHLPLVEPVFVNGLTLSQARQKIIDAYTRVQELLPKEKEGAGSILLTIIRPRQVRVLVIRQDSPEGRTGRTVTQSIFGTAQIGGSGRRGSGTILELPEVEADVLAALAQTGGLPGSDAENEVIIQRGYASDETLRQFVEAPETWHDARPAAGASQTVRIPLRLPPGAPLPFRPEDVSLEDGDIVFIEARDTEFYYCGGVLPSLEVPLPRDYDLDVVEAVAQVGGTLLRGGNNTNNISGNVVEMGIGAPSPSLLTVIRRAPDGRQVPIRVDLNEALRDPRENILVQSGDILILQETSGEAFSRYLADVFSLRFLTELYDRGSASSTAVLSLP